MGKFGEGVGIGDWGYLGFVEQIFFSKIFYIGSKYGYLYATSIYS